MDLTSIRDAIEHATGSRPENSPRPISGGCINDTFQLGDFFVKINTPEHQSMFEAERLGLLELHRSKAVRVPQPVCAGCTSTSAFLVLEYLPFGGSSPAAQEELGHRLAELHRNTRSHFGWERDNFIGATPQPNPMQASWTTFWRDHRLSHMYRLAAERGFTFRGTATLLDSLHRFFADGEPSPSLLHGDLWGGNANALADGTPVIYDPAVYFGDRESDLAMTTLFGGFSPNFYAAYGESWPLAPGHEERRELHNLYHILNHAVLFGAGYARQAQGMIDRALSRL